MKRTLNILLTLAAILTGLLAAYADSGSGQGYDPTNPPEPNEKFRVTTMPSPSQAGYTYGEGLYAEGEDVTVSAQEHENFTFSCWKDGEETVSTDRSYTFKMPRRSVTLVAFYEYTPNSPEEPVNKHRVRIYMSPGNAGSISTEQSFLLEEGESRDISVYPNDNYRFLGWKLDGKILPNGPDGEPQNPLTITMGTRPLEYTAIFSVKSPAEPGTNSFDEKTGKLIIDDFTPGQLPGFINAFLQKKHILDPDNILSRQIDEIIVVGPVTCSDYQFMWNLDETYRNSIRESCTVIDFGLTSSSGKDGNNIPNGSFSDMKALVKVVLPANLERLEDYAFNKCPSMSEIVCYSTLPPTASYDSFGDLSRENTTVRVPSESVNLYEKAEGWKDFMIAPLDSDTSKIFVKLPEDATDGRYRSMTLVLDNPSSGRSQRLIVNDRMEYTFSNLIPGTEYNLYLRLEDGENVISVTGIILEEKEERVISLGDGIIKSFHDLTLTVTDDEGKDVTTDVEIKWTDEKGNYLTTGNELKRVVEGRVRYATITLSDKLGIDYKIPGMVKVISGADSKDAKVMLERLPMKNVTGTVTDAKTKQPIKNAYITIEQLVSGKYKRLSRTITDENGNFHVPFVASSLASGKVTCGADKYITQPCELANFELMPPMQNFELKPISGAEIKLPLKWYPTSGKGPVDYMDYLNLDFSLYNKGTNKPIEYFSNQCPLIVLLEEVKDGDEIEVTVSSRRDEFEPATGSAKIKNGAKVETGEIKLVEHGGIVATFTSPDGETINALLYDGDGNLVKTMQFDDNKEASFLNLKAGKYTLVGMRDSRYYNGINTYGGLTRAGLKEGKDFLFKDLVVEDGKITKCEFGEIPELPEPDFIDNVTLTVNKTTLTVSNYVTVRATVNFKQEYKESIPTYALRFDLPEHCSFVNNSVIKGNEPSNGDVRTENENGKSKKVLWIDNVRDGDVVRFCLMPEKGEEFRPTAFAEFNYDERHYSQPLGSVLFTAEDFTIFVPKRTCRNYVYARGVTTSISDVTLLTNGVPTGNCRSTADGNWVAKVDLIDPENTRVQQIYGEIVDSKNNKFPTLSTLVEYDPYYPELDVVKMVHNGTVVNFNHAKAKTDKKSYSYQPANDMFSLMAKFDENKERVTAVNFHIVATDGSERIIDGVYVESTQSWVAALGYPDSYRLPVNVTVDFTYTRIVPDPEDPDNTVGVFTDFYMGYIAPDVTPIIDPSGFVYEAIEDNRLEGVKVTVFYREGRENMYGEIEWNTVKWDAAEYAQENPLFTDANGLYAWDVPPGEWQVKFEKEGYETAYSAWLPVPPPQLEVNMGMVQNTRPEVTGAHAYADGVDIIFDKPMQTLTLTTENIKVTANDIELSGSINITEEEAGSMGTPMSKVRFSLPEGQSLATTTGELNLIVSRQVKSYAGVTMLEDFSQKLTVEKEITEVKSDNTSEITLAEPTSIIVSALPVEAAVGKTLVVTNDSPDVLGITDEGEEYVLDDKGQAEVNMTGFIPGVAKLSFRVKDSEVVGETKIEVKKKVEATQQPNATFADGTGIYDGTEIELFTKTPQAVIYFTLDGTEPSPETGTMYISPLTVDGGAVVKAIAVAGGNVSEVSSFTYPVKQSKIDISLSDGWNWVSHNLKEPVKVADVAGENVEQILSQTEEVIRDPKLGLIGDLTELVATKSYKMKSNGPSPVITFEKTAVNPKIPVRIAEGWNWIGYSITQTMTPDEAFANMEVEDGDYILGVDGFASFDGEKWIGELKTLVPGAGYMYRSVSDKDLIYNTGLVSKAASLYAPSRKAQSAPWVVDRHKYPSVMPVIADVITPDGRIAEEGEYAVGAFCGSECRGVGSYVDGYLMMSVYGNAGDKINFHLLPAGSEMAIVIADELTFTETPQGSLENPMRLVSSTSNGIQSVADSSNVTVSICDQTLTVSGNVESIDIFDADGRKVLAARNGQSSVSLSGLQPGVHIVVVKADGIWSYHKIMVK